MSQKPTNYGNVYYNSLAKINAVLHRKHPLVDLIKGKGYFYISSDDPEMSLKIASLYTTSIPVYKLMDQSVEQWIKDVDSLLEGKWDGVGEDNDNG